jgi:hypothetical protein
MMASRTEVIVEELSKLLGLTFAEVQSRLKLQNPQVMRWRDATMQEAFEHARYRDIGGERPEGADCDESVIAFTDGTAVACYSRWSGPLSEVTPDIDASDPGWRIFS